MGIRNIGKRLSATTTEINAARLQNKFCDPSLTPIVDMADRITARIGGEVKRVKVAPRSGVPSLEIVINDGSGDVTAVFTGRRSIPGITNGRCLVIEGVAHPERGRHIMLNPAYTLLPA